MNKITEELIAVMPKGKAKTKKKQYFTKETEEAIPVANQGHQAGSG